MKVNRRSDGNACLHVSIRFSWWRMSLSACVAFSLSFRIGALSIWSSVRLKSPIMRSGGSLCFDVHWRCTFSQKGGWSVMLFGAYMLAILMLLFRCQFMDSEMALPGIRTFIFAVVIFNFSLFRTKATPAEQPGRSGSLEFNTNSLLVKRVSI